MVDISVINILIYGSASDFKPRVAQNGFRTKPVALVEKDDYQSADKHSLCISVEILTTALRERILK